MSDDEIVAKLEKYSHEYPKAEADVVYLMVQIGKIIERGADEKKFPVLCFYRNWVVHHRLDRRASDGRTEMLDKLNAAIDSIVAGDKDQILLRLEAAISLKKLNNEIASFFKRHRLVKTGLDYESWFKKFDALLINILVDLSLVPPKNGGYAFTEFKFKRSNLETSDAEFEIKMPNNKAVGGRVVVMVKGKVRT